MIEGKTVVAIIPARKGSRGLPGKNYKQICGKPLIEWSIQAAVDSQYIDEVVVSTNCLVCESIVRQMDDPVVRLIRRPDEFATSSSKTEEAMEHALGQLDTEFDIVCLLQPTSPLRKKRLIDEALEAKESSQRRTLLTVSAHTPFFFKKLNGTTEAMFDVKHRKMRQDINEFEMYFHDDGSLYITDGAYFRVSHCRLDNNPYLFVNDLYCSFQVDTEADFRILSKIMEECRSSGKYV